MNPIRTNKPVFFGDDGEVLKSGRIYIGQPNQWPLSFPKTVTLQDSAGSQFTAAQPLKTNKQGRIEYNGKAVIALVDGNYSMLVHDRNGVTVADGYTPFVENTDSGGGAADGVTQVGLLLSDIKQFNVTPGETVRNVGKTTVLDGLGVEWLVVSNTGNPADDVNLIDFTNGTQGRRNNSIAYGKSIRESGQFLFDDPENVVSTNDATAYRQQWTEIDISSVVPDEASSAIVRVYLQAEYPGGAIADNMDGRAYFRKTGSSAGTATFEGTVVAGSAVKSNNNDTLQIYAVGEATVPLAVGVPSSLEVFILINDPFATSNNTTPDLDISVVGYTINARDIE